MILKSNQELIGACGLEHTEFEEEPCVEIGYDFLSKYWNQDYATEAAKAVKDYAIEKSNIDPKSMCSFIRKNNKASQRVSEKIGMQKKNMKHTILTVICTHSQRDILFEIVRRERTNGQKLI